MHRLWISFPKAAWSKWLVWCLGNSFPTRFGRWILEMLKYLQSHALVKICVWLNVEQVSFSQCCLWALLGFWIVSGCRFVMYGTSPAVEVGGWNRLKGGWVCFGYMLVWVGIGWTGMLIWFLWSGHRSMGHLARVSGGNEWRIFGSMKRVQWGHWCPAGVD